MTPPPTRSRAPTGTLGRSNGSGPARRASGVARKLDVRRVPADDLSWRLACGDSFSTAIRRPAYRWTGRSRTPWRPAWWPMPRPAPRWICGAATGRSGTRERPAPASASRRRTACCTGTTGRPACWPKASGRRRGSSGWPTRRRICSPPSRPRSSSRPARRSSSPCGSRGATAACWRAPCPWTAR